jgi:hypothetical protein
VKFVWPKNLIKAFNALVGPSDINGCRHWLGPKYPNGYGYFSFGEKRYFAHKLAICLRKNQPYILQRDMEVWLDAAHNCPGGDCKDCVEHVDWMTRKQHGVDKKAKKQYNGPKGDRNGSRTHPERVARGDRSGSRTHPERRPRGESHPAAKLTQNKVKLIRMFLAEGLSNAHVARIFGVSTPTIRGIKLGFYWNSKKLKKYSP